MSTQDRTRRVHRLEATRRPPAASYDVTMLDLDGVVYRGDDAVPHAVAALERARETSTLAYVTNNASRPPGAVVARLRGLGVPVDDGDVVTSAQAAARLVRDAVPPGSTVLLVGGEGLRAALAEHGLSCTDTLDDRPAAVVQGFHPDVGWRLLAEGTYGVAAGLPWFASNTDRTVPTARGVAPGNGMLVEAIAVATGTRPIVAGKPEAPLFEETLRRVGGRHPLVVGDRLDTDIEGANVVGADSLLVLTGVSDLDAAAAASPVRRPTLVAADLRGLLHPHPIVDVADDGALVCGPVRLAPDGQIDVGAGDDDAATSTCLLRVALARAWSAADGAGHDDTTVPAAVHDALARLLG